MWTRPILAKLKPLGRESFGRSAIRLYWTILSAEGALSGNRPDKSAHAETLGTVIPPIVGRVE